MYFLYGHPKNFKLKQNYQQCDLCFQIIFLTVMTMASIMRDSPFNESVYSILTLSNMLYNRCITLIIWILSNKRMDMEVKPAIIFIMPLFFICSPITLSQPCRSKLTNWLIFDGKQTFDWFIWIWCNTITVKYC